MAILYVYPALKLGSFASQITELIRNPVEANLINALDQQRAFWKFVGICTITLIGLYIVVIVVAIIFGVIGAAAASV